MAKPELGTKRLCAHCGAKFYDLSKDPIVCPKCGTVFLVATASPRIRPDAAAARGAGQTDEAELPETTDAELVSLEEADAEAQGKKQPAEADAGGDGEDIEMDEELDDATFIAEEEEDSEDVTGIIGGVENEEES